jgi:cyclophilin family peptidyl-prolyl cis-trans isomerase
MRRLRFLVFAALTLAAIAPRAGGSDSDSGRDQGLSGEVTLPGDHVVVRTNHGNIKIRLYPKKAPKTVANFLAYVDAKFYDGTTFHRVIPNFMIQGGGFDAAMNPKQMREAIPNEADNALKHKRGTLAVARAADPNSGQAQFFINVVDNAFLDNLKYCVFGEVVEGMDVVDEISKVATGNNGMHQNVPVQPVVIQSIRRAGS